MGNSWLDWENVLIMMHRAISETHEGFIDMLMIIIYVFIKLEWDDIVANTKFLNIRDENLWKKVYRVLINKYLLAIC